MTSDKLNKIVPSSTFKRFEALSETDQHIFLKEMNVYSRKDSLTILLCFLSLHRAYLGEPMMAILQILTVACFGVGLIWILIDLASNDKLVQKANSKIAKEILDNLDKT